MAKCEARGVQCMGEDGGTKGTVEFLYRMVKGGHKPHISNLVYMENNLKTKMTGMEGREMSLLLWAFAKMMYKPKASFLKRMENRFARFEIGSVQSQSLSLLFWSF